MSFFKKLFGLGDKDSGGAPAAAAPVQEYKGFVIKATPFKEGAQFQLCGVISKEIGGEMKELRFVRADRFASADDATEFVFLKAQLMIDQQGERIFG